MNPNWALDANGAKIFRDADGHLTDSAGTRLPWLVILTEGPTPPDERFRPYVASIQRGNWTISDPA